VQSVFSSNMTSFLLNAVNKLPASAAGDCRKQFSNFQSTLGNLSASQLLANIGKK
jgi:hypothetical protein